MISLLYIGNDPLLTGEITRNFQTEPGWCCDTVRSAGEALDRLEMNPYDVVIAEYDLPDMDGFTLLERLRSSGNLVPAILSAGGLPEEVRHQVRSRGSQIWHRNIQPTPSQISALKRSILQSARTPHSEPPIPEVLRDIPEPVLRSPVGHEPAPGEGMNEDPALNVFYSHPPDGFSVLDPEMTILRVNDTVERWFAHAAPLVGKKCYTAYYAKEEPCQVCPSCEAIRTGQTTYAVMPRMGPDASIQGWMDVCSFPITDTQGNPTAVVEYLSDITGREHIRKLVAGERSILAAGPTVVITWKSVPGNAIVSITPNMKELFGYDPADLSSGTIRYPDLIHPDDLRDVLQEIEAHRNDVSAFRLKPYRIRNREGSFRWVMDHVAVFADLEGKSCTYRSYLSDITESKEIEEVHRQNEILFRIAIETGGISVWESNLVTGQRSCICTVSELFGYRNEEIDTLFRTYEQYMHPDDRIALSLAYREHVASGSPHFACECRIRGKEGAWHWLSIRGSVATRDEQGNPVKIICTFRDVTGMKSDRDAIHAANEKLNLLGSITRHDILNQVMVALGYLSLLDEMIPPGSEYQEFCRQATEATKRIQRQITFTRDYQNLGVKSPEWQQIAEIVLQSADVCSGIRITVQTGRLEIFADPLLERVFFNLFDNSRRHGEHVSEIIIGFHEEEEHGLLTIEDNGIGIPDDRKVHIFERGYGRNSGLGLFLAREILDITGLRIREAGTPGTGARFEIIVPGGSYRFAGPAGPRNEEIR